MEITDLPATTQIALRIRRPRTRITDLYVTEHCKTFEVDGVEFELVEIDNGIRPVAYLLALDGEIFEPDHTDLETTIRLGRTLWGSTLNVFDSQVDAKYAAAEFAA